MKPNTIIYLLSQLLERLAYYGIRGILVLRLLDLTNSDSAEAFAIFGTFTMLVYLAKLGGGLLGDLALGNKKSMIIGGFVQGLGALLLFPPDLDTTKFGIALIAIGGGLYTPNLVSGLGKEYLSKKEHLYAVFSWAYVFINIGAFLGALIFTFTAQETHFNVACVLGAMVFWTSAGLIFATKKVEIPEDTKVPITTSSVLQLIAGMGMVCIFWLFFEIGSTASYEILTEKFNLTIQDNLGVGSSYTSWVTFCTITACITFAVIWVLVKLNWWGKFALGFFFSFLAYYIMYGLVTQEPIMENSVASFALIIGLAEALIAPAFCALIVRFGSPKFIGTLFGAFSILLLITNKAASGAYQIISENPKGGVIFCIVGSAFLMIISGIFLLVFRNSKLENIELNPTIEEV